MREKSYKIGYDKNIVVVKGRIQNLTHTEFTEDNGMVVHALLNDLLPMVEYGVVAWPGGEPLDDSVEYVNDSWKYLDSTKDSQGKTWDYYVSKPIQTFTRDEVEKVFNKFFSLVTDKGDLKEAFEKQMNNL